MQSSLINQRYMKLNKIGSILHFTLLCKATFFWTQQLYIMLDLPCCRTMTVHLSVGEFYGAALHLWSFNFLLQLLTNRLTFNAFVACLNLQSNCCCRVLSPRVQQHSSNEILLHDDLIIVTIICSSFQVLTNIFTVKSCGHTQT